MTVQLTHPVRLEGLRLRPATLDDLQAVHALLDLCFLQLSGVSEISLDELRSEWESPAFDMANDTIVVEAEDGAVVAYEDVWATLEPPVHPLVWGRVHPDFHGQGIGSALLEWGLERARARIPQVPEGARVSARFQTHHEDEPTRRLLERYGMRVIRHFWRMVATLDAAPPAPEWPEGITLRPFDVERDGRAVFRAKDEAFRDHWGHVEMAEEVAFATWKHHFIDSAPDFDPTLWFVAMDGEEIAGVALCSPQRGEDPDRGWLNILGVRRPWRRVGLGRALLLHAFGEFYRRGKAEVGLGVDASNPTGATRLYREAGMRVMRQYDTYELELRPGEEISYEG